MNEPQLRLLLPAVLLLFAVFGFLRGLGRLVLLGLSLAAGAGAALLWFRYVPGLCIQLAGSAPQWLTDYGAIACGLLVAWLVRRFLHAMTTGESGPRPLDRRARVRGGVFGLVPALLMVWGGGVALRWIGATHRVRKVAEAALAENTAPLDERGIIERLARALSTGAVGQVFHKLDPLRTDQRAALGALLAVRHNAPVWNRAAREPEIAALLRHEAFLRLLNDHDITHALSFHHYSRLLALPEFTAALENPALREGLMTVDLDVTLARAISGKAAAVPRAEVLPP